MSGERAIYDRLGVKLFTNEPRHIKVGWDDEGIRNWASFKTQCRGVCQELLGGWWMAPDDAPWPPDPEVLREHGARMLLADECAEDAEGWLCAVCLGIPSDGQLRIPEAAVPAVLEGWPS